MAAQRKHKKIDRTGVLPRQLTGIVKLLAFLLCLLHPFGWSTRWGMKGAQTFLVPWRAVLSCFPCSDRNEPGSFQPDPYKNRTLRNHRRKKIAGQALLTAFFVSVVLALLGAALKDVLVRLILCVALCKMAFLALLCALVILTLFWMLLGILDAFGRRETAADGYSHSEYFYFSQRP